MREYQLKPSISEQDLKIDYAKELNSEQLEAVKHGEGPCLVLAGAGSGKTRTLVYRVAWLLEHGVDPSNILLVTFTNKAAREMLERVKTLIGREPKGLWGGTFHHIGNRVLRRYAKLIGLESNYAILDQDDSKELVASSLKDLPFDTKNKMFPKASTVQAIYSFVQNSQRPLKDVVKKYYRKFTQFIPHLEAGFNIYQEKKRASNALDYDDLLILWLKLLQTHPNIKERLSSQFRYILVDEYQDTNFIQASIIKELSSVHGNVLVVGDDAQSIYSFRSADVKNILDFPKIFKGTRIFKLEQNYRSVPEILKLANASIKNNRKVFKKTLREVKESNNIKPGLVPLSDMATQASFISQRILEHGNNGQKLRDMAVLFRAAYHTIDLELDLARAGIPYIKRGGLRYFEQAHIKDLISYLKILINPKDEIAWRRALKLQAGIGDMFASNIWEFLTKADFDHKNLAANVEAFPPRVRSGLANLLRTLNTLNSLNKEEIQLTAAIKIILDHGLRHTIKERYDDSDDRLEDLDQLVIVSEGYGSVEEFLSDVALSEGFRGERFSAEEDQEAEDNDYLVLSTIHQAKGLEWPVVFVMSLTEGQFPHSRSLNNSDEIEEERRLFYVAVTRAQDELYLTYPISSYFGSSLGRTISGPSRFLKELPSKVYEPWKVDKEITINLEDL